MGYTFLNTMDEIKIITLISKVKNIKCKTAMNQGEGAKKKSITNYYNPLAQNISKIHAECTYDRVLIWNSHCLICMKGLDKTKFLDNK